MKLTEFDYEFLKGQWDGVRGAAYNTVGEDLYEAGMIDDFGFVTPTGQKAIEEYETSGSDHYGFALTEDGRIDVV